MRRKFRLPGKMSVKFSLRRNFLLAFAVVSVFFVASCQQASVDTVNSSKIETSQVYQDYSVSGERGKSSVTATFRVGGATGTTIELGVPGKIVYNGAALDKSDPTNFVGTNYRVKGTDYRKSGGGYQPNHEFVYTDAGGKVFQNSIVLQPLEVAAKTGITLNKNAASRIPFSRVADGNETITLLLGNATIEMALDKTMYLSTERNALVLTSKFWQNRTAAGETTIGLKVKKTANIAQGTPLGGSITAEYTSSVVSVKFGNAVKAAANTNAATQANTAVGNTANSQIVETNSAVNSNTNSNVAQPVKKSQTKLRRKVSRRKN